MTTMRMSGADAAWLGMEAPENLMVVTAVLRFEEGLDRMALVDIVRERMVERYPTFRRKVLPSRHPFSPAVWSDDPDFDLDRHVVTARLPAAPDGEMALAELVSRLLATPLDMSRSPWQLHVVDGPGDGSAVVARLHHCIADGIALGSVLLSLTDHDAEHDREPDAPTTGAQIRPGRRALTASRLALSVAVTAVRILFATPDRGTQLRGPLGTRKGVAWTRDLDLAVVQSVARRLGVTVNDVLLSVTAGALRRHLLRHGDRPHGDRPHGDRLHDVRIFVPVDLRPTGTPVPQRLGNRFGVVFVRLPVSVADPVERVRTVHDRMRHLKGGSQAVATFAILRIVGRFPVWAHRLAVRALGSMSSAVVTNVRGPRDVVLLAGSPMTRAVFWVPQAGSVGLGISILSYAGRVTVGVAADRNVVANPRELADAVEAELDELARRLG